MVPMKAAAGSNHRPAPVIDSRREMRSKPEAPYLRIAEKMMRLEQALFTLTAIQRALFRLSSPDGDLSSTRLKSCHTCAPRMPSFDYQITRHIKSTVHNQPELENAQ